MEATLGVRPLHRTTRTLSPTDEGRLYYEHCLTVLQELEQVNQMLAQRHREPAGRLRLSLPLTLGKSYVADLLLEYVRRYPKVELELSLTDRYVDLIEEGIDLVLRIGVPNPDSTLSARPLGMHQLLVCASPAYLARHGTPHHPQDLAGHRCLYFRHSGRIMPWRLSMNGKEFVFQDSAFLSADNSETLLPFARAGLGLVQLPGYMVADDLKDGALVTVLDDHQAPGVPIQLVYPCKRHLSPKVRSLIDLFVQRWQPLPGLPGAPAQLRDGWAI